MNDEHKNSAECLDDLSQDDGFKKFSELAGDRLGVSPTALVPFMLAMAMEVGVVMMTEQLDRIMKAVTEGNSVQLALALAASQQTLEHFTHLAVEAGQRIGLDRMGQQWPEVLDEEVH